MIILTSLYSLMLVFSIGSTSIIFLFVFLEMLSWVFTMLMPAYISIKYLIMQTYFMILSLMGVLWLTPLLMLGLLLKIGLPPMHIWFMKLSFFMKKWIFLFFSTMHKLLPLMFLGGLLLGSVYFLVIMLLVAGSLIFQLLELFVILLTSSIVHSSWTLLAIQCNLKLSMTYWVLYSSVFFIFLTTIHFSSLFKAGVEQSSPTSVVWLILSGLPPFTMFWLKVWIFFFIVQLSSSLSLMLIFVSVLALTSYFRAFHVSLSLTFFSSTLGMLLVSTFFLTFI